MQEQQEARTNSKKITVHTYTPQYIKRAHSRIKWQRVDEII